MTLVLLLAAAWTLGYLATFQRFPAHGFQWSVIRFQLGLCLAGTIGLVIGSYALSLAQIVLGGIAFVGLFLTLRQPQSPAPPESDDAPQQSHKLSDAGLLGYCCAGLLALIATLSFLVALLPETLREATSYTLPLAARYAQAGHVHLASGNEHALQPHLGYVLYTLVYYRGGETMLSLLAWWFGAFTAVQVYLLGRQLQGPVVGLVGCAFTVSAPLFWLHWAQAGTLLLGGGFLCAALVLLLQRPTPQGNPTAHYVVSGVLLGGALAVLPYAWLAVLPCVALLWLHAPAPRWRPMPAFLGAILLTAAPWLLRNPLHLGWIPEAFAGYIDLPTAIGTRLPTDWASIREWLWLPWDLVMRPAQRGDAVHPHAVWLLALVAPGLGYVRGVGRSLLGFALCGAGLTWLYAGESATLLPYLMLLGPVAAQVLENLERLRCWVLPAVLTLLLLLAMHPVLEHQRTLLTLTGRQNVASYMQDRIPYYPIYGEVNRLLEPGDRLLLPLPHAAYIQGDAHADRDWMKTLSAKPLEAQLFALRDAGVTGALIPLEYATVADWLSEETYDMLLAWRHHLGHSGRDQVLETPRRNAPGVYRFSLLRWGAPEDENEVRE